MGNARFLYNNLITAESMIAVSSLKTGLVTTALKSGTGSAVIVTAGTYTGTVDLEYVVEIDAKNTGEIGSSTFKWSDDGGVTWDETGHATSTVAHTLNNGVTVCWVAGTGDDFILGDKWYFKGINSFKAGNMIDCDRDTRYRSAALGAPNTITISLGSALEVQALVIFDHNLVSPSTITIEFDSSTAFSGGNYHVETVTWVSGKILHYLTHVAGERTRQYWRINITNAANPDTYIEIGDLFLGTYLELSRNYIEGFTKEMNFLTESNITPYGVERSRFYNSQYTFGFEFDLMTAADITNLNTMVAAIASRSTGVIKPFWFNADSAVLPDNWLVRLTSYPVEHNTRGYYNAPMEMIEVMRST